MSTENLLVELFVEELPPKALKKLGEAFASVLADSLKAQGLAAAGATVGQPVVGVQVSPAPDVVPLLLEPLPPQPTIAPVQQNEDSQGRHR